MRTIFAALLFVGLFAAACGGDDDDNGGGDVTNIEDADTCEEVVEVSMVEIQNLLDAVSDMSMDDLMAEEEPEELTTFEAEFDVIGAKAEELNCSDEELQTMFNERIDDLTAEGPVAEFLLEALKAEGFETTE